MRRRVYGTGCLITIFGWWMWQSAQYVPVWHSETTLFAHTATMAPAKPRPLINHAVMVAASGDLEEAERILLRAWQAAQAPHVPDYDQILAEQGIRENLAALLTLRTLADLRARDGSAGAPGVPDDLDSRLGL